MSRRAGTALLAVGYATAVGTGGLLRGAFRQRRAGRFVAFEAGTACVVVGWVLRGHRFRAFLNAAFMALLGLAWWAGGNR